MAKRNTKGNPDARPSSQKKRKVFSAKRANRNDYDDDDLDHIDEESQTKKKVWGTYKDKRTAGIMNIFRANPTVGRPTLLTEDLIKQVGELLETCAFVETVLNSLGVSRRAYKEWIRIAIDEEKRVYHGGTPDPAKEIYVKFHVTVKSSISRAKIDRLAGIHFHGGTQWQALAWLLERMHPEEFGNQAHVIKEILQNQKETQKMLQQYEEQQRQMNKGSETKEK